MRLYIKTQKNHSKSLRLGGVPLKGYVSLQAHRDSRLIASLPADLKEISWRVCLAVRRYRYYMLQL
jgi:hypothetical protein